MQEKGIHETSAGRSIVNSKIKDSGAKIIFRDMTFCAEFLREYIKLPYCENVQPEDIEDLSERYVPLFGAERDADTVKKVNVKNSNPFFFVSLIEHKSNLDYNVSMQIFRYMIYIWEDYEREMEHKTKGISKLAQFQYPPVIPIVYYEGNANWTVPRNFRDRIMHGSEYGRYIPDFEYYLVPLKDYSNEDLLSHEDGISLVMMLNKLQSELDISNFRGVSEQQVAHILEKLTWDQRCIIGDILMAALLKMNMPMEEADDMAGKVKDKKVSELFANMEKMDIQLERRKTQNALENAIKSGIELCQEFGASKEMAIIKICEKYRLSLDEADGKVREYWKE